MNLRAEVTLSLDRDATGMSQEDLEADFAYMIDEWLKTVHTPYRFASHMGRQRRFEDFSLDHYEIKFVPVKQQEEWP